MLTAINCPTCQAPMQQLFGANHAACFDCGEIARDAFTEAQPTYYVSRYDSTQPDGYRYDPVTVIGKTTSRYWPKHYLDVTFPDGITTPVSYIDVVTKYPDGGYVIVNPRLFGIYR